jgi:hypothetical protein
VERAIAWLMTVAAAAGMTAYADGLEKRSAQIATVSAPAGKAKDAAPPESDAKEPQEAKV